jgi:Tfp pilus assembly major pilin PilA
MCGPAAPIVAMMVISAASMAVQQYQSNKARDAAADAAAKQEKLAREAEQNQLKALEEQMEQESDKTELAKMDRQRQALRERAKIRVAASEGGAFGNATLKAISASQVGEGYDKGIMDYNVQTSRSYWNKYT